MIRNRIRTLSTLWLLVAATVAPAAEVNITNITRASGLPALTDEVLGITNGASGPKSRLLSLQQIKTATGVPTNAANLADFGTLANATTGNAATATLATNAVNATNLFGVIHGSNNITAGTISSNRLDATAYAAFLGGGGSGTTEYVGAGQSTTIRTNGSTFAVDVTGDLTNKAAALTVERRVIFPETYGAVVDDWTSDSDAIQAAIDVAATNGGAIVRFQPGRYVLTTNSIANRQPYVTPVCIWIRGTNVTLEGAGMGVTTFQVSSNTGTGTSAFWIGAATNINIRDFTLNGNWWGRGFTNQSESEGFHVFSNWCNVTLENLHIYQSPEDGIDAHAGYGNFLTRNVIIEDCGAEGYSVSLNSGACKSLLTDFVISRCGWGDTAYPSAGINMYDASVVQNGILTSNRYNLRAINTARGAQLVNVTFNAQENTYNLHASEGGVLDVNGCVFNNSTASSTNVYISSSGTGGHFKFNSPRVTTGIGFHVNRASTFELSGGTVDVSASYGVCIEDIAEWWRIDGVKISNAGGNAIRLDSTNAGNGRLVNTRMTYNGAACYNDIHGTTNNVLYGNHFGTATSGNSVWLGGGRVDFNNNTLGGALALQYMTNSTFNNNWIHLVNFVDGTVKNNVFVGNRIGASSGTTYWETNQIWRGNLTTNNPPTPFFDSASYVAGGNSTATRTNGAEVVVELTGQTNVWNVMNYGAASYPANSTTAFNAAGTNLTFAGGKMWVPRAVYGITGTVALQGGLASGMPVAAFDYGNYTLQFDKHSRIYCDVGTTNAFLFRTASGQWRKVEVMDGSLNGTNTTGALLPTQVGMAFDGPSGGLEVKRMNVQQMGVAYFVDDVTGASFDNVIGVGCNVGFAFGYKPDSVVVQNSTFRNNRWGAWTMFTNAQFTTTSAIEGYPTFRNVTFGYNTNAAILHSHGELLIDDGCYFESNGPDTNSLTAVQIGMDTSDPYQQSFTNNSPSQGKPRVKVNNYSANWKHSFKVYHAKGAEIYFYGAKIVGSTAPVVRLMTAGADNSIIRSDVNDPLWITNSSGTWFSVPMGYMFVSNAIVPISGMASTNLTDSTNIARLNGTNVFTGDNTFASIVQVTNLVSPFGQLLSTGNATNYTIDFNTSDKQSITATGNVAFLTINNISNGSMKRFYITNVFKATSNINVLMPTNCLVVTTNSGGPAALDTVGTNWVMTVTNDAKLSIECHGTTMRTLVWYLRLLQP